MHWWGRVAGRTGGTTRFRSGQEDEVDDDVQAQVEGP